MHPLPTLRLLTRISTPIHPPPLPCLQCAAMALCPESPAWLAHEGRPSDAVRALRRLHGTAFRIQDYPKLQQAYIVLEGEEADGQGNNGAASPSGDALQQPLLDSEQGGGGNDEAGGAGGSGGNGSGHTEGAHLGWSALWEPKYRRVMILAAALPLAQQASGEMWHRFLAASASLALALRHRWLGRQRGAGDWAGVDVLRQQECTSFVVDLEPLP